MHTTFEQLLLKKLLGTITAEEEMDFNLWLKANPPYNDVYKSREKEWAEKQVEAPEFAIRNIPVTESQAAAISKFNYRRFLIPNVVALILMIIAAFLFYSGVSLSERKIIAGEQVRTVFLNDSTMVSLKPHSTLVVPAGFHSSRTVELDGQAYFKMKNVPGKPLYINAGNSRLEAMRTSFVILKKEKDGNDVVVFNGRVRLSNAKQENPNVIITPGMRGTINPAGKPTVVPTDTVNLLAWKTDRLTFRNSTLYDVANTVSSYYGVDVHVHDGLTGCRFTATFNLVSLDEVLAALRESMPVLVSSDKKTITLDARGCNN